MARYSTDLCIIGAGSGGLVLASGAVQFGARVTLIEGALMGGDCLNYGCVPSKALLAVAKRVQAVRQGGPGVAGTEPVVDFPTVMARVHQAIADIAPHDSQERFEALGVRVVRAWARFTGPDSIEAGAEVITARRFVIATGAHAIVPDLKGLDQVPFYTNETIFALTALPRVTYTEPELAQIGPTEAEARATHGPTLTVLRQDFSHMDRAITDQTTEGFIKLMIVKGRPIGATLVGAHAGEQISLWALALAGRVKLSTMAGMVAPYPTLTEISKHVAGAYFSPRIFGSAWIKTLVRVVQRLLA